MNREEFGNLAMQMKTFYPRDNLLPNKQAMEMWYRMLQDIPYPVAETFLQKWVCTSNWSPTIAEIQKGCRELVEEPIPDWAEGWGEVLKAIARYGYQQEERALKSLTPVTRQVVKRLGWVQLCMSESATADRANFRATYETLAKREQEDRQLPGALKEAIKQIGGAHELLPEQIP